MKWPWVSGTDSGDVEPRAVLEQIVHDCLDRQGAPAGVQAGALRTKVDKVLESQSPQFRSWAQESGGRLDSALAEARQQASGTEFAGWAIAGAPGRILLAGPRPAR